MKTLGSRWFLVCWFLVFGGVRIPGLMGHLAARVYSFETGGEAVFRLCLVRETVLETLFLLFVLGYLYSSWPATVQREAAAFCFFLHFGRMAGVLV
jgi:hypothetical protein